MFEVILLLFIINLDLKLLLQKEFEWVLKIIFSKIKSNIDVEQLILILLQIESKFSYCQKIYQYMDHGWCCPGQGIMRGKGIVLVARKEAECPSKFFSSVPKKVFSWLINYQWWRLQNLDLITHEMNTFDLSLVVTTPIQPHQNFNFIYSGVWHENDDAHKQFSSWNLPDSKLRW